MNGYFYQCFGQNLDCRFGNGAIVTKDFVIRTRFFQTLPVDEVLTNSIDEMRIAGPPLEALWKTTRRCQLVADALQAEPVSPHSDVLAVLARPNQFI